MDFAELVKLQELFGMQKILSIPVLLLLAATPVVAQPMAPKSDDAKVAKSRFDAALKKAQDDYEKTVAAARRQYLDELDAALIGAMKAGRRDDVVQIYRDLKKAIESSRLEDPSKAATGTRRAEGR